MNILGGLFIGVICGFLFVALADFSPFAALCLFTMGIGLTGWAFVGTD